MPKSVIVIDDEQDFLESVRRGLITSGYRNVSIERDARAAADLIRGGKMFDIALIDITMPGLSGVELLDLIKAESPLTEDRKSVV